MTLNGTAMYREYTANQPVPALVRRAVALSERFDFTDSVHPNTGRFLAALAGGVLRGCIGETGAGTGLGLSYRDLDPTEVLTPTGTTSGR